MVDIAPLRPLRYDPSVLPAVVAPPYDVIDAALRAQLAARDPHNVVHIDLPEGEGQARYDHARALFEAWQRQGVLVRDAERAYFRYAQDFTPPGGGDSIERRGFFAAVRATPFNERKVLPHELTLKGPKLDRLELGRATRAALSPQFMLYPDPGHALEAHLDAGEPFAAFTTDDGVRHRLWRITDDSSIAHITHALAARTLLIADGHHRYETAVALAQEIERSAPAHDASAEHLFTPALLVNEDDPSLVVYPTHRLVHSLARFDFERLLERAGELFDVQRVSGDSAALVARLSAARGKAVCAVVPGGRAALLVRRDDADLAGHPVLGARPDVLRDTAVVLLHDALLQHILGITPVAQAARENLTYVQDPHEGIAMLERGNDQVLFLMNPTPVSVIRRVAEAGETMPQKSTFFYPKVPTGLFFHTLHPDRHLT